MQFSIQRLDTLTDLNLHAPESGRVVISVNPGYPEVRESVELMPDVHGVIDNTALFGVRVVSISGVITGPDADVVSQTLRGYSMVGLRTKLTFEHHGTVVTATGRCANLDMREDIGRYDYTMQWKVQPHFVGGEHSLAAGFGGAGITPTQLFPLSFPFAFNSGTSTLVTVVNGGQASVYPVFTIHGGITKPVITNKTTGQKIAFGTSATVPVGSRLIVDTHQRTAYRDDGTSYLPLMDFGTTEWFSIGSTADLTLDGLSATTECQLVVDWADLYI